MNDLLRFLKYIKPYRTAMTLGAIFVGIGAGAILPLPFIYQRIMDQALPDKNLFLLFSCLASIIVMFMIDQTSTYFQAYYFTKVREGVFSDLRGMIYDHIQRMSLAYLAENRAGGLLSRITSDVDAAQYLLAENITFILKDIIFTCGTIIVLIFIDWQLAALSVFILPLFYLVFVYFGKKMFRFSLKLQEQQAALMGNMAESIAGAKHIQAVGAEKHHAQNNQERINKLEKTRRELLLKKTLANSTAVFISIFASVLIWGFGGLQVIFWGKTIGTIFAAYYCLMNLYNPISNILSSNLQIQISLAAARRIYEFLDTVPAVKDVPDSFNLGKSPQEIIYENITFRYQPNGPIILKEVNLTLKPGKLIGIIGPNGSGKSTLWHLLFRYYELQAGKITIGGRDIREITLSSLRKYISFVPQNEFLFNASIHENVLLGRNMSEEELAKIIETSALADIIGDFPFGLDTVVGEMGMKLSGGQKQRIMLARALVNDPMVLFIDEGISQVDPVIEAKILKNLRGKAREGKIVVLISHKLSTLKEIDELIVVREGKIEKDGKYNKEIFELDKH